MLTRPEELHIFLIRSFAAVHVTGMRDPVRPRDPRWLETLSLLSRCGLDTHENNVTKLETDDRLGVPFARGLLLEPELQSGKPSLFVVWSAKGDESEVVSFFQALDGQSPTHATVANGLILWFRQDEQRGIMSYISSKDGQKRRIYAFPYRDSYDESEIHVLRALIRQKNSSSTSLAASHKASVPRDVDVTVQARAMTPEQAIELLGVQKSGIKAIPRSEPDEEELDESDRPTVQPPPRRGK